MKTALLHLRFVVELLWTYTSTDKRMTKDTMPSERRGLFKGSTDMYHR